MILRDDVQDPRHGQREHSEVDEREVAKAPTRHAASVALLALLLAGCGATTTHETQGPRRPHGAPPASGSHAPPPAWVETRDGSIWLGYSSYCWGDGQEHVCADAVAPRCGEESVPEVHVRRGEVVRFHLAFEPREVSLSEFRGEGSAGVVTTHLEPRQDPDSPVSRAGAFALFAQAEGGGDASYVGCARF